MKAINADWDKMLKVKMLNGNNVEYNKLWMVHTVMSNGEKRWLEIMPIIIKPNGT
jgi:hypothetical protein